MVPLVEETLRFWVSFAIARRHSLDLVLTIMGISYAFSFFEAIMKVPYDRFSDFLNIDLTDSFLVFLSCLTAIFFHHDMFLFARFALGRWLPIGSYSMLVIVHAAYNSAIFLFVFIVPATGNLKLLLISCFALSVLLLVKLILERTQRRAEASASVQPLGQSN
jgi:hypothetical protein